MFEIVHLATYPVMWLMLIKSVYLRISSHTVQITFIFMAKRIWFLANAFAPVLRNTQTRFELF